MKQQEGESALEFLKRLSNHIDLVYADQANQNVALKELTTGKQLASAEKQKQAKQDKPYCIYHKNNSHPMDDCKALSYGRQQQQCGGFNHGMTNQYYSGYRDGSA
uniref:Retrotransposon gag domain-containing protein n=1 Tax=Romanomermis culicivorax TaxID=13658 RepID=A0A915ILL8_ROMCU